MHTCTVADDSYHRYNDEQGDKVPSPIAFVPAVFRFHHINHCEGTDSSTGLFHELLKGSLTVYKAKNSCPDTLLLKIVTATLLLK